ncbi:hypothetical protein PsorP6_006786 [Peronosclerospora sorghi]|uniref:Uncharacterized protein n=1 Tax=Peronosclerospora sorghi TaxID=230839 RepID=A0ACC0W2C1_9STRA|nr:hypothetical protein PsorP6_006786 [Peronosclerospora sorghi]
MPGWLDRKTARRASSNAFWNRVVSPGRAIFGSKYRSIKVESMLLVASSMTPSRVFRGQPRPIPATRMWKNALLCGCSLYEPHYTRTDVAFMTSSSFAGRTWRMALTSIRAFRLLLMAAHSVQCARHATAACRTARWGSERATRSVETTGTSSCGAGANGTSTKA